MKIKSVKETKLIFEKTTIQQINNKRNKEKKGRRSKDCEIDKKKKYHNAKNRIDKQEKGKGKKQ